MEILEKEGNKGMGRRDFLLLSAGALCASILFRHTAGASEGASGQGSESLRQKDGGTAGRVLIAYATRCGSTAGVAEAIGKTLRGAGAPVDVSLAGKVNDLSPYRSVIVGSAIRMGKWLPEAVDFVKEHKSGLSRMPTAYFVVCNTMKDDTPENRGKVLAYLDPVRKEAPQVQPANTGLFAGAIDFGKLSFVFRSMLKAKGAQEGDFRNWTSIKNWATEVAPALVVT